MFDYSQYLCYNLKSFYIESYFYFLKINKEQSPPPIELVDKNIRILTIEKKKVHIVRIKSNF